MKLLTAVILAITLTANQCEPPKQSPKPTTKCVEGDACWNCKTMGNKKCGPSDRKRL